MNLYIIKIYQNLKLSKYYVRKKSKNYSQKQINFKLLTKTLQNNQRITLKFCANIVSIKFNHFIVIF